VADDPQQNRIADVAPQSMDLHDDFVPGIAAGKYRFVVQQSVGYTLPETQKAQTYCYYRDQRFVVQGPRYSLAPDDIHCTYPPDGGTGSYGSCLPHIVLRKRALPWERREWGVKDEQDEPYPWLALLVLTQSELDAAHAAFGESGGSSAAPG
jgi:hypothetical protein